MTTNNVWPLRLIFYQINDIILSYINLNKGR
jgi:hypothetical protein